MKVSAKNILTDAIAFFYPPRSHIYCKATGKKIIIYEPAIKDRMIFYSPVMNDLLEFKQRSDVIVANRWSDELEDVKDKVYTRDIFQRD